MGTRKETTAIVVHCSATRPSQDIGVREIDRWHRQKGYFRVGYHLVIRRDGTLEKGRDLDQVGAHARDAGYNRKSVGICLVGGVSEKDVSVPENNFTDAQFATLSCAIAALKGTYPTIVEVIGHRDIPGVKKACPSFDVSAWLGEAQ